MSGLFIGVALAPSVRAGEGDPLPGRSRILLNGKSLRATGRRIIALTRG